MNTAMLSRRVCACGWLLSFSVALLAADDPWAAGQAQEEWSRVSALQRYPLYDAKPPDLAAACKDASPLVRAAAALAVGRAADPKLLPALVPLFDDEWQVTRRCALCALTQIDSPDLKAPLLRVLNSWSKDDLEGGFPSEPLVYFLQRVGLPNDLAHMELPARQAWLKKFDSAAWTITLKRHSRPLAPGDEGDGNVIACLENSQVDAGEPIPVRVRFTRAGGKNPLRYPLGGGSWYTLDAQGRLPHNDLYEFRFGAADKAVTLPAAGSTVIDESVATKRKPLPPGLYMLQCYASSHPMLVRVRQGAALEKQLPELLKNVNDVKTIRTLGEQRVRAAVPALIDVLRAHAKKGDGLALAAAEALGRIGDPAAVPALLEQHYLRDWDVIGDTSGALRAIGSAAYPAYDERIGNWKKLLISDHPHELAMSLRLRGPSGPEQIDRARLELLEHLAKAEVDYAKTEQYGLLEVFQSVVAVTYARHPEKTTEAIWATRTRPGTFASLVNDLRPPANPTIGRMLAELWQRVQSRRAGTDDAIRDALVSQLIWHSPETLLAETAAIRTEREAQSVANLARRQADTTLRRKSVERVREFLKANSEPGVQLLQARLLLSLKQHEESEKLLDLALPKVDLPVRKSEIHYFRGHARLEQGKLAEGKKDLQTALDLLPPNHGYDGVYHETIRRDLERAGERMAAPGVKYRKHAMEGWDIPPSPIVELAGGRGFFVDPLRRLRAWDPIEAKGAVFGVLPQVVRDFMPLDRTRVFVAFLDGTAALYEEGKEAPVWKRSLPLSFNSYLSASPRIITAADEQGGLHALDPQTGKTLWSRKVPGKAWPERWWRGELSAIRQHGDHVLIPDRVESARTIECVQISTGKTLWSHASAFGVDKLAVSDGLLLLAGRSGEIAAVSLADGKPRWQKRVEGKAKYPHNDLAVALGQQDKVVYLATRDTIWSFSAETGEQKWTWKWTPLEGKLSPTRGLISVHVCPADKQLYVLVNWDTEGNSAGRLDIVVLTPDGKPRLRQTAPRSHTYAENPSVKDSVLSFRRGAFWEFWDTAPLP